MTIATLITQRERKLKREKEIERIERVRREERRKERGRNEGEIRSRRDEERKIQVQKYRYYALNKMLYIKYPLFLKNI